jgi:hypothetical protein
VLGVAVRENGSGNARGKQKRSEKSANGRGWPFSVSPGCLGKAAIALLMVTAVSACATAPRRINAFENLTPSSEYSRTWTSAEARQSLAGFTFLRNHPGRANEVIYFAPGGIAYQWVSKRPTIASGTWTIDLRSPRASETARVFVCTTFNNRNRFTGEIIPDSITNRCVDPSLFFIPASEHAKGDTFKLAGRPAAPGELTVERVRIEDLKRDIQ